MPIVQFIHRVSEQNRCINVFVSEN